MTMFVICCTSSTGKVVKGKTPLPKDVADNTLVEIAKMDPSSEYWIEETANNLEFVATSKKRMNELDT